MRFNHGSSYFFLGGDSEDNFRNRKGYFSINVQCICNPWLQITNIVSRWPGVCRDQTIFDNSVIKRKFKTEVLKGYLLGDGGYELKLYLMTPLLVAPTRSEQLYNDSHTRTKNIIKRYILFGWKGWNSFRCIHSKYCILIFRLPQFIINSVL